jgi:hypothetical protein
MRAIADKSHKIGFKEMLGIAIEVTNGKIESAEGMYY